MAASFTRGLASENQHTSAGGEAWWHHTKQRLAVERVGLDAPGSVVGHRCGGGAIRLALCLVLEARQEFAAECSPGIARENVGPGRRRELLRPQPDDIPAGCHLQEVGF